MSRTSTLGRFRRRLLGVPISETTCRRRRFRCHEESMKTRIEWIGETFLTGYHSALSNGLSPQLTKDLDAIDGEIRGFAVEGAAMGLALMDRIWLPKPSRIERFLEGYGRAHIYMVHVGVGWMWARIPWRRQSDQKRLDPVLSWLAMDGWGFHQAYFGFSDQRHWATPPSRLNGYERRAFDQGMGRALWFTNGGNPALIADSVAGFAQSRQMDLWSGVGLAAAYAGIISEAALTALAQHAGPFRPALAQGAAFAAKARLRAGNATEYSRLASRKLCGLSIEAAAQATDAALENLPARNDEPAYEVWRARLRHHFRGLVRLQEVQQ